jgi:hypothetical protein
MDVLTISAAATSGFITVIGEDPQLSLRGELALRPGAHGRQSEAPMTDAHQGRTKMYRRSLIALAAPALGTSACSATDTRYSVHGLAIGQTVEQVMQINPSCVKTLHAMLHCLEVPGGDIRNDGMDPGYEITFTQSNVVMKLRYWFTTSEDEVAGERKILARYGLDRNNRMPTEEWRKVSTYQVNDHLVFTLKARQIVNPTGTLFDMIFDDTALEQAESDAAVEAGKRPTPKF